MSRVHSWAHVLKHRFFGNNNGNLSKLGGEEKAIGVAEGVLVSTDINNGEFGYFTYSRSTFES
jgi:hypothetical protein